VWKCKEYMCGSLKIRVRVPSCIATHALDVCERTHVRYYVANMCGNLKNVSVGVSNICESLVMYRGTFIRHV